MARLALAALLGYLLGVYLANHAEAQACQVELMSCADELGEAEATLERARRAVRIAEIVWGR